MDSTTRPRPRPRPEPPSSLEDAPLADEFLPSIEHPAPENGRAEPEPQPVSALERSARPPQRPPTPSFDHQPSASSGWLAWIKGHPGKTLLLLGGAVLLFIMLRVPLLFVVFLAIMMVLAIPASILLILFWPYIVRRQQIVDRWDTLITGGQGQAERVIVETVELLRAMQLPQVRHEEAAYAPGILRSLAGDKRPFLVVSQTGNANLRPYRMYINVRDYGDNLQTSWYLTYQPGLVEKIRHLLMRNRSDLFLDLFDEQDLRAYVVAVHRCFVSSVVELLATLGQDASKLNRSSSGFLGIS